MKNYLVLTNRLYIFGILLGTAALLVPSLAHAAEEGVGESLIVRGHSASAKALAAALTGSNGEASIIINQALCRGEDDSDLLAEPLELEIYEPPRFSVGAVNHDHRSVNVWVQEGPSCVISSSDFSTMPKEKMIFQQVGGTARPDGSNRSSIRTGRSINSWMAAESGTNKDLRHGVFQCPQTTGNSKEGLLPHRWRLCVSLGSSGGKTGESLVAGGFPFLVGTKQAPEPTDFTVMSRHEALQVDLQIAPHGPLAGEAQAYYARSQQEQCPPCQELIDDYNDRDANVAMASLPVNPSKSKSALTMSLSELRPFEHYCVCAAHRDAAGNLSEATATTRILVHQEADAFVRVGDDLAGGYCGASAAPSLAALAAAGWLAARSRRRLQPTLR